jgi:hypothetical protein
VSFEPTCATYCQIWGRKCYGLGMYELGGSWQPSSHKTPISLKYTYYGKSALQENYMYKTIYINFLVILQTKCMSSNFYFLFILHMYNIHNT